MWDKKHLIEIDPFSGEDIEELFKYADILLPSSGIDKTIPQNKQKSLDLCKGKKMNLWFGEESTRTYGSFETAMLRLGGVPLKFDEKVSSIKKKESIKHTARILSGQCDILVDRHRDPEHIYRLVKHSLVPVINGGNGSWQHPTQTLLDLYTMYKESGIKGKIIAIVGDLRYGRTSHSLIRGLGKFDGIEIHGVSPPGLEMPKEHMANVNYTPHVIDMRNLKNELEKIRPDYIYATRVQLERIPGNAGKSYQYQISKDTLENLPNVRIMHPLPIATNTDCGPEIAEEMDEDPRAIYFRQADYGIPVRMAIITVLLGFDNEI
jgi:aspartate carbamoyltransferase catalytic subunit